MKQSARQLELRYTNRIHRDDCAGVLRHLMRLSSPETLYLATDNEPADQTEVFRWLAKALGLPRLAQNQERRLEGLKATSAAGIPACCNPDIPSSIRRFAKGTRRFWPKWRFLALDRTQVPVGLLAHP